MISLLFQAPILFIIILFILIISIAIHEFSHAYIADKLGDPTPRAQDRLTLNPFAHIDLIGIALIIFIGFGWGKPVPYDPFNLRNPHRDSAIIALAGPVSSFLFALFAAAFAWFAHLPLFAYSIVVYITQLNVMLAIFNLIPVYPLDGFRIVSGFLPEEQRDEWVGLERYGLLFLIILLLPIANGQSVISMFIAPTIRWVTGLLLPSMGGLV